VRSKTPFVWALALALILAAAVTFRVRTRDERVASASACSSQKANESERERDRGEHRKRPVSEVSGLFSGPKGNEALGKCDRPGHPETFEDLAKANSSRLTREVAPGTQIKPGAQRSAVRHARALPTIGNAWAPLGNTPLFANRTEYDQTLGSTGEGFVGLSGRATAFARDPGGTLYAAVSNGGIWKSTDNAGTWSSIADKLPTQVVSGLAWTNANGGTLLVLTGDNAYGGDTYAGLGVYRSTDDGKTWRHSSGVPDGLLGFKIAVDPNDQDVVYAATGGGLFRSTDGGASFDNVNLPTGKNHPADTPDCSGKPPTAKDCFLANMVTDVVVQGKANSHTTGDSNAKPGAVLAAVGWRAGTKKNADGAQQSPGNGIYHSNTGAPGSFTNLDMAGNSQPNGGDPLTQPKIGRIALGIADGPQQDHRYVYALVMDAAKFNGGFTGDENLDAPNAAASDYLNGIWVSPDFGHTWKQLEGSTAIDNDPTSNSALAPPVCKEPTQIAYCPGIQAWYNLWTQPDPTQQTSAGVPTRLAFGLEEVWANPSPDAAGLDGSAPKKFEVIGRYYGNTACTPLLITNDLPVCPAAPNGKPPTTTHPDQHGVLWIPDASGGGVTLVVGNDGGVYKQHAAPGEPLSNNKWGDGNNSGLHTLQPYDAEMAKDGTVYMGLQDNGEAKIEPNGDSYTIYGGDGFFTAVDPDNSKVAYEEYTNGDMSVTTDGGKNWTDIQPSGLTAAQFATPFQMDPANAGHLIIGGRDIRETTEGPTTTSSTWSTPFDLGTQKHPGDAAAASAADDPDNQLSAVDVRSQPTPAGAGSGAPTSDFGYSGGDSTVPDPVGSMTGDGSDLPPGTYDDHPFTIAPNDGDASMKIRISWSDGISDWDLFLFRTDSSGNLQPVAHAATGDPSSEQLVVPDPPAGNYVIRVANFTAQGTYDAKTTFLGRGVVGPTSPSAAYVGYCGFCDTIIQGTPFANGIATNVKEGPGKANDAAGWHIAKAAGLPSRYITSVRMDPSDPRTVYATIAGYGRRWAFPGAVGEDTSKVGTGHVFKSTDAGETFTDVTGDLPDTPANWSVLHNGHLVVGTDTGVFESCDNAGGAYSRLGTNLPAVPISTLRFKPGDPDLLVAATYGRGVYTYRFGDDNDRCAAKPGSPGVPGGGGGPKVCAANHGFKSASVVPRGRGLRFLVKRRVKSKYTAKVFRKGTLQRTADAKTVVRFRARKGSFTWRGSRKLAPGYYVAEVRVKSSKTFDLRRFPVLLRKGRFHRLHQYWGRASCKLLRIVRLSGPVFGGQLHTSLLISFRTNRTGKATVTVRRGSRVVKRYKMSWKGAKTVRRRLHALHLKRGSYSVTVAARAGKSRQTVKLYSRRI
jgi:photosystem II stability/assembly factor-like uncharacterized protein